MSSTVHYICTERVDRELRLRLVWLIACFESAAGASVRVRLGAWEGLGISTLLTTAAFLEREESGCVPALVVCRCELDLKTSPDQLVGPL